MENEPPPTKRLNDNRRTKEEHKKNNVKVITAEVYVPKKPLSPESYKRQLKGETSQ
jgi:hypothetical protein